MYDTGLKNKCYFAGLAPFGVIFYPLFLIIQYFFLSIKYALQVLIPFLKFPRLPNPLFVCIFMVFWLVLFLAFYLALIAIFFGLQAPILALSIVPGFFYFPVNLGIVGKKYFNNKKLIHALNNEAEVRNSQFDLENQS